MVAMQSISWLTKSIKYFYEATIESVYDAPWRWKLSMEINEKNFIDKKILVMRKYGMRESREMTM